MSISSLMRVTLSPWQESARTRDTCSNTLIFVTVTKSTEFCASISRTPSCTWPQNLMSIVLSPVHRSLSRPISLARTPYWKQHVTIGQHSTVRAKPDFVSIIFRQMKSTETSKGPKTSLPKPRPISQVHRTPPARPVLITWFVPGRAPMACQPW
ncbi:hypothetical protein D3C81_923820 [compost metagenome]